MIYYVKEGRVLLILLCVGTQWDRELNSCCINFNNLPNTLTKSDLRL
jgi:putative component of toxin-antitoxin plasmid stabilization module